MYPVPHTTLDFPRWPSVASLRSPHVLSCESALFVISLLWLAFCLSVRSLSTLLFHGHLPRPYWHFSIMEPKRIYWLSLLCCTSLLLAMNNLEKEWRPHATWSSSHSTMLRCLQRLNDYLGVQTPQGSIKHLQFFLSGKSSPHSLLRFTTQWFLHGHTLLFSQPPSVSQTLQSLVSINRGMITYVIDFASRKRMSLTYCVSFQIDV